MERQGWAYTPPWSALRSLPGIIWCTLRTGPMQTQSVRKVGHLARCLRPGNPPAGQLAPCPQQALWWVRITVLYDGGLEANRPAGTGGWLWLGPRAPAPARPPRPFSAQNLPPEYAPEAVIKAASGVPAR